MTNEQREAIKNLDEFANTKYGAFSAKEGQTVLSLIKEQNKKIEKVLDLIFEYGQIDGAHHKMWVIDQIVRILTGDKYKEWVKAYIYDEETGDSYSWDKGIAP